MEEYGLIMISQNIKPNEALTSRKLFFSGLKMSKIEGLGGDRESTHILARFSSSHVISGNEVLRTYKAAGIRPKLHKQMYFLTCYWFCE